MPISKSKHETALFIVTLFNLLVFLTRYCCLFQLCPKFLHTNSTSHTWPFSAIAELIGMWINNLPAYMTVILFSCYKTFFLQSWEGVDLVTIQKLRTFFWYSQMDFFLS